MRLKCFTVFLVVAVSAVTAQLDYSDEDTWWWSDEVPVDQLGRTDTKDEPAKDISLDKYLSDEYFDQNAPDDDYEEGLADNNNENKQENIKLQEENLNNDGSFEESNVKDEIISVDQIAKDPNNPNLNANNIPKKVNENTFSLEDDTSKAVREEIEQFRKKLDGTEDEAEDAFKDYQIEDNRLQNKYDDKNLPSDSNENFEANNFFELLQEYPVQAADEKLDYPEFNGDLDKLGQKEQSNIDYIITETKEILEEENSPSEEDLYKLFDSNEKQENVDNQDLPNLDTNNEDKYISSEKSANAEGSLEIDQFFDDIIENQQNEKISSYLNYVKDKDINQLQNDDINDDIEEDEEEEEKEDDDDEVVNSAAQESDSDLNLDVKEETENKSHLEVQNGNVLEESVKYENDMINADEQSLEENAINKNKLSEENNFEEPIDSGSDEDTVDKVYADLHDDLTKLFETWDKLTDDTKESDEGVLEYEEKYGKPFREGVVLSQREEEYDNYGDINDNAFGSNLADIFSDSLLSEQTSDSHEAEDYADNANLDLFEDKIEENKDIEQLKEQVLSEGEPEQKEVELQELSSSSTSTTTKTVQAEDLTPSQYKDLMVQFAATHTEEIDTFREDFGKNIAPVHMDISYDQVTEITSPNYPSTYPTNNVIDWILEGDGTGIELNVTDLELRGAQDDFLLIKPGGADDTGHNGLLFSYHLSEPRSYRFTDVNRVFIRFNAGSGLGFLKGFRLTVKNIWPPEAFDFEEIPPAEHLLPYPPATLTVNIGGMGMRAFKDVEEKFRRLIADMATMYINANSLEAGLNATSDVTQLTDVDYCNVNWPNFDTCLEVTFGVPLVYKNEAPSRLNEQDLRDMWYRYVSQDPFASRLRAMGIMEYAVPDEFRVMMVWTVLACGVLMSAAMLAFALWRYSCIVNYTRMKTFSDTDSLHDEKRGLDLYPTPHQTLPPLYADSDYKWADEKYEDSARVDLGGFANRSYVRDELLDIDSDEDVIAARDRYTTDV